ncbi:DUF6531 domain-containing protein [Micromonospora sp. M12]
MLRFLPGAGGRRRATGVALGVLLASTSGAVVVPAQAAPPQADAKPASAPPAQPASPGSPEKRVLGPSNAPVSQLAGPISVPLGTGPVRNGTFSTFQLTDRLTAQVNTGSGNLLIRSTDLVLPGVADSVVLGAAYNSLLTGSDVPTGSLSYSWRTRTGADVKLIKADDNSVTYVAADGVIGRFTRAGPATPPRRSSRRRSPPTAPGGSWSSTTAAGSSPSPPPGSWTAARTATTA